jgi:hypothetical protein
LVRGPRFHLNAQRVARVASVATLCLLVGCDPGPAARSPASSATPPATNASAAPADSVAPDFQKLVGRWLRPDGGYVLEIRACDAATGRLEASYLNPRSINVARAEAKREGGKLTVFVELQDADYPGCTYRLTYFPPSDGLYGVYYQAAIDQSFEVDFERTR